MTRKKTTSASKRKPIKVPVKKGMSTAELNQRISTEENIRTTFMINESNFRVDALTKEFTKQDTRWKKLLLLVGTFCVLSCLSLAAIVAVVLRIFL